MFRYRRALATVLCILGSMSGGHADPMSNLTAAAFNCLNSATHASECAELTYCETPLFIEAFGPIQGAGRGWCEGNMVAFWNSITSLQEATFKTCISGSEEHLAFDAEIEAFRHYQRARCRFALIQNQSRIGAGTSDKSACILTLSAMRAHDLAARIQECAEN